jgi:hypothetical protein
MIKHPARKATRSVLTAALAALTLSACSMTTGGGLPEGIGFREARFAEISAAREWRACRDEALALDAQARQGDGGARYLTSARLIEKCESGLGPEHAQVAQEERMRAYALAVQNHLKGGDVAAARAALEKFKAAFNGADLYYADGSSFSETMEILLGLRDRAAAGEYSVVNAGATLKAELRRSRYWKNN